MSSPEPLCGALAGFILVRFLVFYIIANRFPNHRTARTSSPEYSFRYRDSFDYAELLTMPKFYAKPSFAINTIEEFGIVC